MSATLHARSTFVGGALLQFPSPPVEIPRQNDRARSARSSGGSGHQVPPHGLARAVYSAAEAGAVPPTDVNFATASSTTVPLK